MPCGNPENALSTQNRVARGRGIVGLVHIQRISLWKCPALRRCDLASKRLHRECLLLEWQILHRRALRKRSVLLHRPVLQQSLYVQWEIPVWGEFPIHPRSQPISGHGLSLKPATSPAASILSAIPSLSLLRTVFGMGRFLKSQFFFLACSRALLLTQSSRPPTVQCPSNG
jgi:hypothetical protein